MGSMWEGDAVDVHFSLFFCAAIEVEALNPRVAYLCRLHGLRKAGRLHPTSSGHGVPPFKTLRQRLDRDDSQTLEGRVHSSDAREMLCFYRQYQSKYQQLALRTAAEDDRTELIVMHGTANALSEVLNGLLHDQEHELSKIRRDVTREALRGLRRRRHGSQEHVVTRRAVKLGGGGSKSKQS